MQKDKQYYIKQFWTLLDWRCSPADKSWYKNKFQWRIEFNASSRYSHRDDIASHCSWPDMCEDFRKRNFVYRRRYESMANIYTSDLELLELVLNNPGYKESVYSVEYTNDKYLNVLASEAGIDAVTDIKFVSHLQTEFRYQVFLGNFEWKDDHRELVTSFLVDNMDEYQFRGYYHDILENRKKGKVRDTYYGHKPETVYDGFNFFAKSTEDILMLHLIAPGKIKKIIKLMERT